MVKLCVRPHGDSASFPKYKESSCGPQTIENYQNTRHSLGADTEEMEIKGNLYAQLLTVSWRRQMSAVNNYTLGPKETGMPPA